MRGKAVQGDFFKPVEEEPEVWKYRCGTKRKGGLGYANFVKSCLIAARGRLSFAM